MQIDKELASGEYFLKEKERASKKQADKKVGTYLNRAHLAEVYLVS